MAEFNIFRNHEGKVVWTFAQSGSNKLIAKSWEGHDTIEDCKFEIELLKDQVKYADISEDVEPAQMKKKVRFKLFGK